MSLKYSVNSLDDVPEAARVLYAEKDGHFVLSVDGVVPKERLDEFRDNNLSLRRELEETKRSFDGIDPARARELMDQAKRQREGQLVAAGKVDELVAERVGAMRADYEKQLGASNKERDALRAQLSGLVIDGAIRDAALKVGVRPTAVEDVLLRGRTLFRLESGKAVAMDGDKPVYGKAGEPLDVSEWVGGLATTAPHLFEPSKGGGAPQGGNAGSVPGTVSRTDPAGFLANLQNIAAAKVAVN